MPMAASGERVDILLKDFGGRAGLGDLALDDQGYCCLLFGERIVIDVDHDAAEDRLLLSAFLGRPAGDQATLHIRLLEANFLGQGAGGCTLSLHGASGGVVLWRELSVAALDIERLESAIEAFVAAAERWMGAIADEPQDSAAAGPGEAPAMGAGDFVIRA
jgi:hypothetical protein